VKQLKQLQLLTIKKKGTIMKKLSIEKVSAFVNRGYNMQKRAKKMCIALLSDTKDFPTNSIVFNLDEVDAPSYASGQFDDDVTDCSITKVYVENGVLKADLHAYYFGEDTNGVDLTDELNVDYIEILDYINTYRLEINKDKVHLMVQTPFGEVMLKQSQENKNYVDVFSGDNYDNYLGMFLGNLNDDVNVLSQNATSVFSDFND